MRNPTPVTTSSMTIVRGSIMSLKSTVRLPELIHVYTVSVISLESGAMERSCMNIYTTRAKLINTALLAIHPTALLPSLFPIRPFTKNPSRGKIKIYRTIFNSIFSPFQLLQVVNLYHADCLEYLHNESKGDCCFCRCYGYNHDNEHLTVQ